MRPRDGMEKDHIDPRWKEGRNYQLVCGLDVDGNTLIVPREYNTLKQNRFVPYRVCEYSAPVEYGDLCEFLIENEWKVCEFGGDLWKEESRKIGFGSTEGARAAHTLAMEREVGWYDPETRERNRQRSVEIMREVGSDGKGKKWWYHPEKGCTKSFQCPGEGWIEGRGSERWYWWVNREGVTERGPESPGEGWQRGRTWSS